MVFWLFSCIDSLLVGQTSRIGFSFIVILPKGPNMLILFID